MIDKLNAKKAALVAQRDQAVANLNALVGAIAFCDEMIAEAVAEQIAAKAAAAEAEQIEVTSIGDTEPHFVPAGPEMLPVEKFVLCSDCPNKAGCDFRCECDKERIDAAFA